jgi:trk system potassium uptake protein
MRSRVVARYLGSILLILGGFLFFPLIPAFYFHESDWSIFLISAGITSCIGLFLYKFSKINSEEIIDRKSGLALVAISWIAASAFGSLPYIIAGIFPSYIDAYFEAMSGFTTTGATVLTSIETQSHGILLWRNLTQWLGGMGIMTFFIAFGPAMGVGVAYLFEAEIPGPQVERLKTRIRSTAQVLWAMYLALSVFEILLLLFIGKLPLFDASVITFGTMPTGGFLNKNLSIAAYDGALVSTIVTVFMILAGVNFGLYYYLWKKEPRRILSNVEFRLYIAIMAIASLLIIVDLTATMGMPVGEAIRHATFQAATIQTTTGFVTTDFNTWPAFSRAILLTLMIIGASAGSTGGGLKVIRIAVLMKYAVRLLHSVISPKAVYSLKIGGNVLPEPIITRIVGISIIYFSTLVVGSLMMCAVGLDLTSAFSAVAATLGNVGPGLAAVGPVSNYFAIPAVGKVILILCMLIGRLEFLAVIVLIVPAFWKWR